jgi:uncharacterized damage-inducible protein DinB
MLHQNLPDFYTRELLKLQTEINLYKNEAALWVTKNEISNSAGNLCLHLIGNINHFIGATLGNTGYVRTREVEFSAKNISREKLIADLQEASELVKDTLGKLSAADYSKDFPLLMQDKVVSTEQMLLYMLMHLSYHLGQINYHRRLI